MDKPPSKRNQTDSTPERTNKAKKRQIEPSLTHEERPTVQRVQFHLAAQIDTEDDDSDYHSSSPHPLLSKPPPAELPEGGGFLTAKNSSDAYFLAHGKSNPTSTNLFSARNTAQQPLPVSSFLQSFHPQALQSAQTTWNQWTAELIEGYSILFYGLGSKRATLNQFVEQHLVASCGWEGLIINGFQAGCNLSSVLNDLEDIIEHSGAEGEDEEEDGIRYPTTPQRKASSLEILEARAQRLCLRFEQKDAPNCVLMLHNLDGLGFRNPQVQTILGLLTAHPRIHFLATMDHIHAPILVSSHLASARPGVKDPSTVLETFPSSYNFLYHHLPTPTAYTLESLLSGTVSTILPPTIFPPIMIGGQSHKSDLMQNGVLTVKATLHVLSSLTEKAKALFRLLAEHQIARHQALPQVEADRIDEALPSLRESEEQHRAPKIAISTAALFELARAEFVASALTQMHALLVEFRDHAIILAGLPPAHLLPPDPPPPSSSLLVDDDQEWLWIALSQNDLHDVLSKLDDL
ncbi:hypothetical protein VP01_1068g4 [Puccinia sorghi]|uniref:Origin recognition complex subunit 2 n=1 Tax=Puccinia sorghi TaxID=27349 RepID=A0A0L6VTP5_9BASI|nr:hypothetical protein VP01_1068g4 [Puccinia sorghi]